jgi:hypothetical protein
MHRRMSSIPKKETFRTLLAYRMCEFEQGVDYVQRAGTSAQKQ